MNFVDYGGALFSRSLRHAFKLPTLSAVPQVSVLDLSDTVFALNYYLDYISPVLNPVSFVSSGSTMQIENAVVLLEQGLEVSTMIQYLQQHLHVFHMMLALGAMYLLKLDTSTDWLAKSRAFRREGMRGIAAFFSSNSDSVSYSTDKMLTLVLLMFYELAEEHNENWAEYLHGAGRLYFSERFMQPQSDVERALLKFSLELLNYQETMGRTACKARSNFFVAPDEHQSHLAPVSSAIGHTIHVSWMGCDKDLILIILDITELLFDRMAPASVAAYRRKCANMRVKLDSMQLAGLSPEMEAQIAGDGNDSVFRPMDVTVTDKGANVEVVCYLLACEAKRIATVIYLECSLLNKTPKHPEIRLLVLRAYRMLEFVVIQHLFKWFSTLLWTIFVIAAEIAVDLPVSEELRYLTLEILKRIESRSLGNVSTTVALVVGIWKNRDLGDGVQKLSKADEERLVGFRNDWDIYVADELYRVSLA